jgi:uncharacterized protein (DUF1778 family)
MSNAGNQPKKCLYVQRLIFLAERGDYIDPYSATPLFSVISLVKPAFSVVYYRVSAVASVSAMPSSPMDNESAQKSNMSNRPDLLVARQRTISCIGTFMTRHFHDLDKPQLLTYSVRTFRCEVTIAVSHSRTIRTRRINLRATDRQEKLIRTGAETTGLSVTNFILDSACLQAERVLADKREFIASPKQWKAFVEALDRPAQIKPELARLFSATGVLERESRK